MGNTGVGFEILPDRFECIVIKHIKVNIRWTAFDLRFNVISYTDRIIVNKFRKPLMGNTGVRLEILSDGFECIFIRHLSQH